MPLEPRPGVLREILANLVSGLKVVADEAKYLGLSGLRNLEIRQMEKRLDEESAALGAAVAKAAAGLAETAAVPLDEAARQNLRQMAFLHEELGWLRAERDRLRSDVLARRAARLGLDPDQDRNP